MPAGAADRIVRQWLGYEFEPNERSSPKLDILVGYELRTKH